MKTFVVRLHEDAGSSPASADVPPLRGVLDEVATGLRATFRDERELVAALKAAIRGNPAAGGCAPD